MSRFVPSIETFAKGMLATAATLSTVGVGLLYYGQNYLIYPSAYPPGDRLEVPVPSDYDIPYDDVELKTPDGFILRCYLLTQKKRLEFDHPEAASLPGEENETDEEFMSKRPTVIMFHGNGGNHGHRIPLARVFFMKMRCNVFMLSYRGYGKSEGSPSEKGLCIDAQAALDYITSDPYLSKTPIVLFGQSIGGAVAIDLASRNPSKISALILENTFTSLPEVVPHALPLLGPFSFLCHQKWDSINKIPLIPATTPVLMLSGAADELIPKDHMRSLWEAVAKRGEKKTAGGSDYKTGLERAKFMEFENGGHNDTCVQTGYWTAVAEFVASLGAPSSSTQKSESSN
ncbi:Alpha/Beta hydrolase protein [Cyathus striatus]|nr:Alpha/Beta hydrolase protein [Cyathus striatus]